MTKRTIVIILSIIASVVLIVLLALFIRIYIIPVLNIGNSQTNNPETFLMASQSPDGKYNLEAYRTEPGATVDFSIRVYLITDDRKSIIYDAYHEYEAKIVWIGNTTVSINGKTLDISQGEKYDWRTQKAFCKALPCFFCFSAQTLATQNPCLHGHRRISMAHPGMLRMRRHILQNAAPNGLPLVQ